MNDQEYRKGLTYPTINEGLGSLVTELRSEVASLKSVIAGLRAESADIAEAAMIASLPRVRITAITWEHGGGLSAVTADGETVRIGPRWLSRELPAYTANHVRVSTVSVPVATLPDGSVAIPTMAPDVPDDAHESREPWAEAECCISFMKRVHEADNAEGWSA